MTTIRMRLTEQDLIASMRAHFMNGVRRPTPLLFWSVVVVAVVAVIGLVAPPPDTSDSSFSGRPVALLMLAALLGAPILTYFVTIPLTARRALSQQKNLGGEIEMSWDAARIVSRGTHGVSDFAWGDYRACLERDGMVLLYQTDQMFQFAPARAFASDAERREMIGHFKAAGVPEARVRPKGPYVKPA